MFDLKFAKEVADFLTSNPPFVIAISIVLFFFSLLPKLKHFVDFKEELKKQKISKLTEAYQSEFSPESFKQFLEEEIQQELFYRTTGIRKTPKSEREKILAIVSQSELDITHFKRAQEYLHVDNGILSVKLSRLAKFVHYITITFSGICAAFSLLYWCAFIFSALKSGSFTNSMVINNMFQACLLFTLGLLIFTQTLPVISAKKIQQKLMSIQQ